MSSCDGVPLPWPLSSWSNVKEWIVGAVLQLVALQSVSIFSSGAIGEAPGGPPGAGDDGPLFGSSRLLQMGLSENRIPPKFHQISWCILYILIFPYFPYSHIYFKLAIGGLWYAPSETNPHAEPGRLQGLSAGCTAVPGIWRGRLWLCAGVPWPAAGCKMVSSMGNMVKLC